MPTRIGRPLAAKRTNAKACPPTWRKRELRAQPKVAYGPARHKTARPARIAEAE